jgi:hypothetical protein
MSQRYHHEDEEEYNRSDGGHFIGVAILALFPFIPFMVFGYEIGKRFTDTEIVKYGAATVLSLFIFILLFFGFKEVNKYFKLGFLYILMIPMMYGLNMFYPENIIVKYFMEMFWKVIHLF